jgi:hypothetical protein
VPADVIGIGVTSRRSTRRRWLARSDTRSVSSAKDMLFSTTSSTPKRIAVTVVGTSRYAECKMVRGASGRARIVRSTSRPSTFDIRRSRTITSYGCVSMARSAPAPSLTMSTASPRCRKTRSRTRVIAASSSTMSTREAIAGVPVSVASSARRASLDALIGRAPGDRCARAQGSPPRWRFAIALPPVPSSQCYRQYCRLRICRARLACVIAYVGTTNSFRRSLFDVRR